MKRAALVLFVVPLVALWLYGCDKAQNPLETQSTESTTAGNTPLYAPGGKVKPEPLPQPSLLSGFEIVSNRVIREAAGPYSLIVRCPEGKAPITGGYTLDPADGSDATLEGSNPDDAGSTFNWRVSTSSTNAVAYIITVYAACVEATGTS